MDDRKESPFEYMHRLMVGVRLPIPGCSCFQCAEYRQEAIELTMTMNEPST